MPELHYVFIITYAYFHLEHFETRILGCTILMFFS